MIYRVQHVLLDLSRIAGVAELRENAAYREFTVFMANGPERHEFKGKMNTPEGTAVARAYRELMDLWEGLSRDIRTWRLSTDRSLLFKLRNLHLNLLALTAVERAGTDEPPSFSVAVHVLGRAEPFRLSADGDKVPRLRQDYDDLTEAWQGVMPALEWSLLDHRDPMRRLVTGHGT